MSNDTDSQTPEPPKVAANSAAPAGADQARSTAPPPAKPKTEASVRDARLKAALKANMARRKGQARARAGTDGP